MTPTRFPHSEIPGSQPVCGSPRLIAAYHVLHRLSAPRHPPCTLSSLTKSSYLSAFLGSTNLSSMPDSVVKEPKTLERASPAPARDGCRCELERDPLRTARARKLGPESLAKNRMPEGAQRLGGADRNRTDDFRLAKAALSQLSYSPEVCPSGGPR